MPYTRMDHQLEAAKYLADNRGGCLWMTMRTGKTLSFIESARMVNQWPILVVCPVSVFPAWVEEFRIDEFHMHHVQVIKGTKAQRKRMLDNPKSVNICNYDMLVKYDVFRAARWKTIVLDESIRIGNISAQVTQYCMDYVQQKSFPASQTRVCLSGSPASESAVQLIPQVYFVRGEFMGYTDPWEYLAEHWKFDDRRYKWVARPFKDPDGTPRAGRTHVKRLKDWNKEVNFCKTMEDIGMGSVFLKSRYVVDPTPEQEKLLATIAKGTMYTNADGKRLEFNPLTKSTYEMLVASGVDPFTRQPIKNPKIDALIDMFNDTQEPMCVWSQYKAPMHAAYDTLTMAGIRCATIDGDTDGDIKEDVRRRFQNGELDIVLGQVRSIKMGLDFSRADTIVYLCNSFSQDDRTQSEMRATRVDKNTPVQIIDLCTAGTLDEPVVELLNQKQSISTDFIQIYYQRKNR